jgi:hypothetical protein
VVAVLPDPPTRFGAGPLGERHPRLNMLPGLRQVFAAHRSSAHRQTRFTQINVTGRPAAGRSRTRTGRRPCGTARTPQPRQNSSDAVVSIAYSSSPSTSSSFPAGLGGILPTGGDAALT